MRVVALAFDSGERTFIEELLAAGHLPNLARIRERSARWNLAANSPRNEYVWAEFLAGGIPPGPGDSWEIHDFDPSDYCTTLRHAAPTRPFWADAVGDSVVTLDVPRVTAADDDGGVHVVGWGSAQVFGPRSSRPAGLLREIDQRFGPHPMVRNDQAGWHHARRIESVAAAMERGAATRVDVARFLLDRFPDWKLFVTVWSETHPGSEFLWHGVDPANLLAHFPTAALARRALVRIYEAVDAAIGKFVDGLPDDVAVVVFSLNGIRSGPGDTPSGVLLPELLYRLETGRSLLRQNPTEAWKRAGCPPVAPRPCQRTGYLRARRVDARLRDRVTQGVIATLPDAAWPIQDALRRVGARVAGRNLGVLGMVIPAEGDVSEASLLASRTPIEQTPMWYARHWPQMRAFALPSFGEGYVRCNVEGRERSGVIAPSDYDRVCKELSESLLACTSPRSGRPVVRDIVRQRSGEPAAVLDPDGPYADLVVVWEAGVDALEHPEVGTVGPFPIQRVGGHTRNGFAIFDAPGFERGERGERGAADFPGMILSLLGDPAT